MADRNPILLDNTTSTSISIVNLSVNDEAGPLQFSGTQSNILGHFTMSQCMKMECS